MSNLPETIQKINRVTNVKTMSSREIAKLTDKRHDHVLRDIEVMLKDLEVNHPKFGAVDFQGTYKDKKGKLL